MKFKEKNVYVDLVIAGAGLSGICAAIQAARKGLRVALINNRGVLGGNASCEIGVNINGANDGGELNLNAREGGICSEILLEYKYRSPNRTNPFILDSVFLDFIYREKNIQLFLNTCIDEVNTENSKIISISGTQNTSETRWNFYGKLFVDNTGDGTLGYLAGAEYMIGREAKKTFNEMIAPDEADDYVLLSTLKFTSHDTGYKVPFVAPDFAYDIEKTGILERRKIKDPTSRWYYEVGAEYDQVNDREKIIHEHKKLVFGIWNYLKNSGKHPEYDTYDFDYISTIPGTREYRRLKGDYILTENDIRNQTDFPDTIGHGGWNIDLHALKGIFDEDLINRHIHFDGIYKIPYRILYSHNIKNLFMSGRNVSVSHVAFGSIRVMATLSVLGQAVGMAASMCIKYNCSPRDIYISHIEELQQSLLEADQFVVGKKYYSKKDKAKMSAITASSEAKLNLDTQTTLDYSKELELIPPQFKSFYKNDYENLKDSITLTNKIGLSFPVNKQLDSLSILIKANQDTELFYDLYLPNKPENYGPDNLIKSNSVRVTNSNNYKWIDLPINYTIDDPRYVLVTIRKNPNISIAVSPNVVPTTCMFSIIPNTNPCNVHISTLEMKKELWRRSSISICYKVTPNERPFEPSNVINGYNRPYGKTNMWLSDFKDKTPELIMTWDKPTKLSSLIINFAIDTTKRFYSECINQIFEFIGQEYEVIAECGSERKTIAVIKNNHRKVNRIEFEPIKVDRIIFKFLKSSTGQVGVTEIRAY